MNNHVKAVLLAAGLFLAWKFSSVLLLIFAAIVLAVGLGALTSLVQKTTKLPYSWSFPVLILAILAIIGLISYLAGPSLSVEFYSFSERFPAQAQLAITQLNDVFGLDIPINMEGFRAYIDPSYILQATQTVSDTFGVAADIFFLLIIAIYLVISPDDYKHLLDRLSNKNQKAVTQAHRDLKWWLLGRLASMAAIFILTWIGLAVLGMPFALVLGLIAGLLSFIPNLGPILALVPAFIVGIVQSPMMALYVIVLYVGVQLVESYFITPQIDRKTVSIPPAMQLISQLIFGTLFGFLGLVLAVPITVSVRALMQNK